MTLEAQGRDRGEPSLLEPPSQEVIGHEEPSADAGEEFLRARAPAPQQRSPDVKWPREREDRDLDEDRKRRDKPHRGLLRRHPLAFAISLLLFLVTLPAGYLYWDYIGHFETTDDAYIAARQFAIAPKVSGYITAVPVTDNQHVAAGQVIARIDDRDYRVALKQAEAQVAAARANIKNYNAQIAAQEDQIRASQAQVEQTEAGLIFARQQSARYTDLAHTGYGTVQNAQQYTSGLRQQEATLKANQAALAAAQRQLGVLKAQQSSAIANLAEAKAQRDQAALNLSYTTITAAQPGRIVQLTAAVGQYAQPGTNLSMFVPDDIWVTANFKETQLDHMRPGQKVTIDIDAYSERTIHGHLASVQPGSGTAFSLLPAENATGNWVKIVQRVPVKIIMDNPPTDVALGPGMSVETSVRVNPHPSLYERLRGWL